MSKSVESIRSEYVESLRRFLGEDEGINHPEGACLANEVGIGEGSSVAVSPQVIQALEEAVNRKSARCEAADLTPGERYQLARDYVGLSDAQVAEFLEVSTELVSAWGQDRERPFSLGPLAALLRVPRQWLEGEDVRLLPANCHLGARVGQAAMRCREQLYSLTLSLLSEVSDEADDGDVAAFIENAVLVRPELKEAARRCGGRWQLTGATLSFRPWAALSGQALLRAYWPHASAEADIRKLTAGFSGWLYWEAWQVWLELENESSAPQVH